MNLTKPTAVFLLLLLGWFTTAIGQETLKPTWPTFTSEEGGFSVILPTKPELKAKDRKEYQVYSVHAFDQDTIYKVVFSSHKQDFSKQEQNSLIKDTIKVFVNSQKGKITKEKSMKIDGIKAQKVRFKSQDGYFVDYVIFIKDKSLFTLSVINKKSYAPKKAVEKFFSSFTFL